MIENGKRDMRADFTLPIHPTVMACFSLNFCSTNWRRREDLPTSVFPTTMNLKTSAAFDGKRWLVLRGQSNTTCALAPHPLSPPYYLHGMMETEQGAGEKW